MKIYPAVIAILLSVLVVGVGYIFAFQGPTEVPPGGSGAISVDTAGNVGIGVPTPEAKLDIAGQIKISGGSPADGKVLTSDESGLASWQTPVTPTSTSDKVIGEGRPGTLINLSGECTVGGLKLARSLPPVTWEGAAAGCPKDWWVCSAAERGTSSCGSTAFLVRRCSPSYTEHYTTGQLYYTSWPNINLGTHQHYHSTTLYGPKQIVNGIYEANNVVDAWVADAFVDPADGLYKGKAVSISGATYEGQICQIMPTWCCAPAS